MQIWKTILLGLVAGAIGTVLLTVFEKLDMALTHRPPSTVPGQVGVKLLGGNPEVEEGKVTRLNPVVHWSHGIALGAVRGLLGFAGLGFAAATALFYAIVWVGDATLYRTLRVADVPWRWERGELVRDLLGKGVLAVGTSIAYAVLTNLF